MSKEKAREIREKAAPIIDWLRTAEEESSDDEGTVHDYMLQCLNCLTKIGMRISQPNLLIK